MSGANALPRLPDSVHVNMPRPRITVGYSSALKQMTMAHEAVTQSFPINASVRDSHSMSATRHTLHFVKLAYHVASMYSRINTLQVHNFEITSSQQTYFRHI